ncbi:elongin-C-like [Pistacia vera]|uniref:elongin-C-like n=1 Tax=Pistacia vera TaxID=55513 RepID=UPI001262BEF0|nr:elongin-C-like [Pistacia vera]
MKKEDTVKLISAEGFEFVIDKEAAMVSQTIRNMLTSPGSFAETQDGKVTFPEISTTILEKICQYFYWSLQYARFCFFFSNLYSFVETLLQSIDVFTCLLIL